MAVAVTQDAGVGPVRARRRPPAAWTGTVPFFGYAALFLLLPTGIVIWNAFRNSTGGFTFANLDFTAPGVGSAFIGSFQLSLASSLGGAIFGAVLAYAVATGNPNGMIRRLSVAASGVLAQFGGVTLAFAFLAAIGPIGLFFKAGWYSSFPWGIAVIYLYFQIPLMVLVFLPAIDGLKTQWREASESLGGSTWHYWRYVGGPLLAPAFLGAALLLFANSLSAFATIVAWEDQISYVVPQLIGTSMISEVGLNNANQGDALAVGMIVMVVIIMVGYFYLQRRTARWLR
jgi:putative spermidine/putrescine transport system permease protein